MSEQKNKPGLKRRRFLKYTGGAVGLIFGGIYLSRHALRRVVFEAAEVTIPPYMGSKSPQLWFQVTPENEIILHSAKVEMGQGVFTGLAQLAAEELEVGLDRIKVVHAESITGNVDQFGTGGSLSIAALWKPLREMAATMRQMLLEKAAEKMEVSIDQLKVSDGRIFADDRSLTYGEVVQGVTNWKTPSIPTLKDRAEFRSIGKSLPRVDLQDKIKGAPIFGIDASLPNMLYGSVVRSDFIDSAIGSVDVTEAESMPGVVAIIQEDDFVGVVAETQTQATQARLKIKIEWEKNRVWNEEDLRQEIRVGRGTETTVQKQGNDLPAAGEDIVQLEYSTPLGAHAQLEPNGAVADYSQDKLTVILSTQVVAIVRRQVAKAMGMKAKNVNIIPTYLGGGFGRRLHTPHAIEAAKMSRAVGRPVKCFFDRKQEFQNDTFRPPSHHIMRGKVSPEGVIEGIEHRFASGDVAFDSDLVPGFAETLLAADIGSIRGGSIMYRGIENIRSIYHHVDLPFATSFWRSLGLLANTFAIETFIDELALQRGLDPVKLRTDHLESTKSGQRIKAVIDAVAKRAGYRDVAEGNRAFGLAASIDAGSPCAQVAEVSVEDGEIQVHKVTAAFDCGIAVNPDLVKAQVEGCILMGMSASMFEKMTLKENMLSPIIYGAYEMAMLRHAPKEIDVLLIEGDDVPGPVGEPPLGPIAAAIGNAVRRITGQRLTEWPMKLS